MAKNDRQSPLKGNPLRRAGQSVQEEIDEIHDFEFMHNIQMLVFGAMFLVLEWLRWIFNWGFHPIFLTIIFVPYGLYAFYKVYKSYRKIHRMRQGRDGERLVGEYLERLQREGYHVFHDLVGEKFNVDHVLIGKTGVYAIETKTWSKPINRKPVIERKGGSLVVDGIEPDRNPVDQAKACSSWVAEILKDSTGKNYNVRPVVLFPGWFIQGKQDQVWVLNPRAFPKFLENENVKLPESDVTLASSHLSRFIRSR